MSREPPAHLNVKFPEDLVPLAIGGWSAWSSCVKVGFMAAGLEDYITGAYEMPTSEEKLAMWELINSQIVGVIAGVVNASLRKRLKSKDRTAAEAWNFLQKETYQGGIVGKLVCMRSALKLRFTGYKDQALIFSELDDCLAILYEDGVSPTIDEMKIILLMNCLEGTQYDWLRRDITNQAARQGYLSLETVAQRIKTTIYDVQRLQHDEAHPTKPASETKSKRQAKCSNYGSTRHIFKNCWAESGGSAGQAPEWWKLKQDSGRRRRLQRHEV